jgi:hypothetical protein
VAMSAFCAAPVHHARRRGASTPRAAS